MGPYYPFAGWCVGDRGLESLEFERGERVSVEMTVFDYACNEAPPVTQEIEWPIEGGDGCSAGTSGRMPIGVPVAIVLSLLLARSRSRRNGAAKHINQP